MPNEDRKLNRRSMRLKEYDYTQSGAYFLTLCAYNRKCLFGEIIDSQIILTELGKIVKEEWERSPSVRSGIVHDEFIIMPNHIHGIVFIENPDHKGVGATGRSPLQITARGPQKLSLGAFVSNFKASVTLRFKKISLSKNLLVWQRNYYEHVIRNDIDLEEIREYIQTNSSKWLEDENHPARMKK